MASPDATERSPGPGRPRHRDIARLAGTSQTTVSLVLSGRDGLVRISDATRQAVLAAARQLGYTPDLGARRLRQADAAPAELTLAILRPAGVPLALSVRLLEAAASALALLAAPAQLVLEEYQPGRLADHAGILRGARFHGAIISSPTPDDERFLDTTAPAVPVVVFQRHMRRAASVDVDNAGGGLAATQHLLATGRRRIAALGWSTLPSGALERRLDGYRTALRLAGLEDRAHVVHATSFSEAGGAEAAARLLATQRPDAILALSDVVALGVMAAVRAAGHRIPDDVAVLGYDDLPFAPFLEPPLTTVRLPYAAMGEAAVAWLAEAVRGRADGVLHRVYQPELIIRRSG